MDSILAQIRHELEALANPEVQTSSQRFFKDDILSYGIKTATVTALAKKYWKEVKNRPKPEIFALCEELYRSGYLEESFIVAHWAHALSGRYGRADLAIFRRWIETYVTNWASCDGLCNHAVGEFVERYPECIDELNRWAQSKNRWMRRASAASLIVPAKHGKFLNESIQIADLLLTDADDMVQKACGWLLKEASRKHTKEVFVYVMKNKRLMPRTALRYAIELMPKEMKAEAMKKDW